MVNPEEIDCPICGKMFKLMTIERHAAYCTNSCKEKPITRSIKSEDIKEKSAFFSRKSTKRKSTEPSNHSVTKKNCNTNEYSEQVPLLPKLPDCDVIDLSVKQERNVEKVPTYDKKKMDEINKEDEKPPKISSTNGNNAKIDVALNKFQQDLMSWAKEKDCKDAQHNKSQNETDTESADALHNQLGEPKQQLKQSQRKPVLGKLPLAEQMRPESFDEYYGQNAVNNNILKELFYNDNIPSMILWGPPGCGKTSLAHIISQRCKSGKRYRFVILSATTAGVNDVKEAIKVAKNERKLTKRKTVLFVDEVHRFNKLQQDSFLPHVEDGTITLIGATTENPSFHVNNALMSRCRVVVLKQLKSENIEKIIFNAIDRLGGEEGNQTEKVNLSHSSFTLEPGVVKLLADYSNGDARIALNSLDMVLQSKLLNRDGSYKRGVHITCDEIRNEMKCNHLNYDRKGDEHFDIISALQKSIRGSDVDASLYWLARMLQAGEQPLYIARRLVRTASEDIGLADHMALQQAVSAYQACHLIGMPECDVILAQAVVYLAKAAKSNAIYAAYDKAKELIQNWDGPQPTVPFHLRNPSTQLMKRMGYGKDYKYTPEHKENPEQNYLPEELIGKKFYSD